MAVVTVVSGTIGYAEEYPDAGLADWVFHAARLPFLSFDPAVGEPIPETLNFARFAGFAVALYAAVLILVTVFRERHRLWRACRATGHVVVVGAGPESAALASAYLRQTGARAVVVLGNLPEAEVLELRRAGANVITAVTDPYLQQILREARDVVISAENDSTAVRLARRIEDAIASPTFHTVVLLDSRELAEQWGTEKVTALGRNSQVAIAALRDNPPRLEDRACPPPIVIGDGDLGAEIVRRMVIGWQEIGEQFTVHCLGPNRDWVRPVRHELRARADLQCHEMPLCTEALLQQIVDLVEDWPVPPARKAQSAGPTIVVALSDPTRGFPIAVALAECLSAQNATKLPARVSVLVDDVEIWESRLRDRAVQPEVVSFREELADPATLSLDKTTLLAEELIRDASRWPSEVPGLFGQLATQPGASSLVDVQPAPTQQAIRRVAESALNILAEGNIVPGRSDDALIVLSPNELVAIGRGLLTAVTGKSGGHDPELGVRALEFAARLPTLVARAGWTLRRRVTSPSADAMTSPTRAGRASTVPTRS